MKLPSAPFAERFLDAGNSIGVQLRRVLIVLLGIQAVLALALIIGAVTTSHAVSVLVKDRLYPIGELQRVSDSYANALATAHKVESGNLSTSSAIGMISIARANIISNWTSFRSHNIDSRHSSAVRDIENARRDADATIARLTDMLSRHQTDRLPFFVSGPLYAAIDPLTVATDSLNSELRDDAIAEQRALQWSFLRAYVIVTLLTLLAALVGWWGMRFVSARITQPLDALAVATQEITDGRKDTAIVGLDRQDEIGAIARALLFARQRSLEAQRLSDESRTAQEALHRRQVSEHAAKADRAAALERLFARFEADAASVVGNLKSAGPQLRDTAAAMSGAATDTEHHALATAALAEQSASSARTIASSSVALASAIDEISKAAQDSRAQVSTVHDRTIAGRAHAESLGDMVTEIASVLDLISGLAGQTNLLALNATIEAARAGEAGRGFAVVAEEVKGLARQTQLAASKIDTRLAAIRSAAGTVLETIQSVDRLVAGLDESSATVAGSVEQQRDMTRRIADAIAEVEDGTADAAHNMQRLNEHAGRTRGTATALAALADNVAASVETLRRQINGLIADVRAA